MTNDAATVRAVALDARYGRTPQKKRRDRIIAIVAGAVFVVVLGAWVAWAGLGNPQGSLEAKDLAHKVIDDRTVSVTWQVSTNAGTAVACAVEAQNEAHAIVGWKIVELPPSPTYNTQYSETIRTSQNAVTGLIYRCWLA